MGHSLGTIRVIYPHNFNCWKRVITGEGSRMHIRCDFLGQHHCTINLQPSNRCVETGIFFPFFFFFTDFTENSQLTTCPCHPALFLSEKAPLHFPGFSIMCIAVTVVWTWTNTIINSLQLHSLLSYVTKLKTTFFLTDDCLPSEFDDRREY